MSPEFPNQPDEPANPPPAQAFPPPPVPRQAKAVDSSPPPWPSAPMDKVSLFALITAIPGFGLVSIPLGHLGRHPHQNH